MIRRLLPAVALALAASAHAQDYPTRPIRIIVPYPAGGSAGLMPRIFAGKNRADPGAMVSAIKRLAGARRAARLWRE
jgi:tripartite-type tricarboxylate transporter receptor subunit TctC